MTIAAASPLLTAPIGPTIVRMAAPNIAAMLVTTLTAMAEAWYVGQLGTAALAGLALAFPMLMLVNMLSAGAMGGAITGAVARRLGAGDRPGAETLAFHAVLLALLLAGACAVVFLLGGRRIYSLLGGTGQVLEQALAYSDVVFLGCVSIWLANTLASVVRATGRMRVAAQRLVAGRHQGPLERERFQRVAELLLRRNCHRERPELVRYEPAGPARRRPHPLRRSSCPG